MRQTTHVPPRVRSDRLTTSTWWHVVTYSGTEMLTQHPDSAYAPVNVWENGYLVPIRSRARCTLADRPGLRHEVVPDFRAANASCPVPAEHPVWEIRLHQLS
jgi:hypothetical protein